MAKLDYDEVKPRTFILYDGVPHECLENHVARTQKRKPQNQVKLRNLMSGATVPVTFHASDTAEGIDVGRKESKFLYASRGVYWFCNPNDAKDRYELSSELLGDGAQWLKPDTIVDLRTWEDGDEEKVLGVKVPVKVTLKVTECPPAIKGNTASGGDKLVTLETGAKVTTPLFIEVGDMIIVNTDNGEYVERAK